MSPPNPTSPAAKQQQGGAAAKTREAAVAAEKMNHISYSVQNYIKELEISEGQLSSVVK